MNDDKNRRVLIIDDNRAVHEDFRKILAPDDTLGQELDAAEASLFGESTQPRRKARFEMDSAFQGEEGVAKVQAACDAGQPYAVAFVDVRMPPGMDGVETTLEIWAIDAEIQVVLCTAYSDYSWDEILDRIGGNDRMVILKKPFDSVEAFQLANALSEKWRLHREAQERFEKLEATVVERTRELSWKSAFLEAQVSSSVDGVLVVNDQGKKIYLNQRLCDLWKIPPVIAANDEDEVMVQFAINSVKDSERFAEKVAYLYAHPDEHSFDEVELKDHTILDRYSYPVIGGDGTRYGRIWTFRDVTHRKRLEAQVSQSQKLETVGKLAGGVAHEFNSIMTAIIGQSDLLLGKLSSGNALSYHASEIRKGADRAAGLTRQLLAYGRKQLLQTEVLDLGQTVSDMRGVLGHLLDLEIELHIVSAKDLHPVKADAGQIEEVIANIAMNARDAMPEGGTLTLETSNFTLERESETTHPDLKVGNYVVLALTDTGVGMEESTRARIFDPFFSTKPVGKGVGLGLSTSYGIVRQSGGHIAVESEPGRGTTFKVYLPAAAGGAMQDSSRITAGALPRGTEKIIFVEEDPSLREMAVALLARLGYEVLSAGNGLEALAQAEQTAKDEIALLLTDVAIPNMNGRELADKFIALHPAARIVFTSTQSENLVAHHGGLEEGIAFLRKPFTPTALAEKLREVLNSGVPVI